MAEKIYEELKKQMKDKSVDPDKYLRRVIEEIKKDDNKEFVNACEFELRTDVIKRVKAAKNKHEKLMVEICIECMKKKTQKYYELAKQILDEKTVVKWKGHEDAIEQMTRILEEPIEWEPTNREKENTEKHVSWDNSRRALKDAVENMIKACSRDKMIKKVAPSFSRLLSSAIKSGSDMHIVVAIAIVETSEMAWEGNEKLIPDVLEAYDKWLRRDDVDLEENRDHKDLAGAVMNCTILENAGESSVPQLKSIMEYCLDQELEGDELPLSVHGFILQNIITGFIMSNSKKVKIFKDLLPYVVKLLSCDVKDLESMAGHAIGLWTVCQNCELLAHYGDDIADAYLDNKCEGTTIDMALKGIFQYKPEVVLSRLDRIFEKMEDMESRDNMFLYMLLDDVGKKNAEDLLPYVVKLLSCDVENLYCMAGYVYQNGELLAPYGDDIADAYLDNKCEGKTVCMALKSIFQYKPEVVLSRLDRIFEKMKDMKSDDKIHLYMLLDDVGKKNAEVLVPHIDLMFEDICDTSLSTMVFMTLANISIGNAEHFVKHLDRCFQAWEQFPYTVASACKTIASIGRLNKIEAKRCLNIFFGRLDSIDPMWISVILMEVKRIGQAHKECLAVYRPQIEKLKTCQQMGVPDMVQSMIDFLDDRSLHGLSEEVAEQRKDIDNLDFRVTNTGKDITRIDETVAQQSDEIQNVKREVNEKGERLDELKEVMDETVEKVEEIDHKTITNAPKWSRDVSKLLNPQHEQDWRFLAVRLGYSGEDIRNWALSPDPTMAILAEWYTTHKSSDATYAILSALEDMGRTDAAEIITQSLEEAGIGQDPRANLRFETFVREILRTTNDEPKNCSTRIKVDGSRRKIEMQIR